MFRRRQDAATVCTETPLHNPKSTLTDHLFIRCIDLYMKAPSCPNNQVFRHLAQVPHLFDPIFVYKHRALTLQQWRHLIENFPLNPLLADHLGLEEVLSKPGPHLLRHVAVAHEPVKVVHIVLERRLILVQGGNNTTNRTNNVGPHGSHYARTRRCHAILQHRGRSDVTIADARKCNYSPIQGKAVNVPMSSVNLVRVIATQLYDPAAAEAPVRTFIESQSTPDTCHPMAANQKCYQKFRKRHPGIVKAHLRVPTLCQALETC
mmetsp:Transcript_69619/g.134281  ORF Transcript_69619/g.134281 Transcript_69619/m.134281 type:complete len:263 (-) Transcript_69619:854-1642(-)